MFKRMVHSSYFFSKIAKNISTTANDEPVPIDIRYFNKMRTEINLKLNGKKKQLYVQVNPRNYT